MFGDNAAARGSLAQAERLLRDVSGVEQGWLHLARSEGSRESSEAAMYAETALEAALAAGDPDSGLRALAGWDSREFPRERSRKAWHGSWGDRGDSAVEPASLERVVAGHLLHVDAGVRASR